MPTKHSPVATSFFFFLPSFLTAWLFPCSSLAVDLAFSHNSLSYSAVPTYSRARAPAIAARAHAPAALAQWHATSTRTIEVGAILAAAEKTGAGEGKGKAGATRQDKVLDEAAAGAALANSCPSILCMRVRACAARVPTCAWPQVCARVCVAYAPARADVNDLSCTFPADVAALRPSPTPARVHLGSRLSCGSAATVRR